MLKNIETLQEEIKNYQNGYKAFEQATRSLSDLAKTQGDLTGVIKTSTENLEKIDSVSVLKKVEETAHEMIKMSEELDSVFDKLAVITNGLSKGVESFEKQALDSEKASGKLMSDTEKKIEELYSNAEKNVVKMMKDAGEKYAKLMSDSEQKILSASEQGIRDIEKVTSEISAKVKSIDRGMESLNAKIDEGVKVKKRFF